MKLSYSSLHWRLARVYGGLYHPYSYNDPFSINGYEYIFYVIKGICACIYLSLIAGLFLGDAVNLTLWVVLSVFHNSLLPYTGNIYMFSFIFLLILTTFYYEYESKLQKVIRRLFTKSRFYNSKFIITLT